MHSAGVSYPCVSLESEANVCLVARYILTSYFVFTCCCFFYDFLIVGGVEVASKLIFGTKNGRGSTKDRLSAGETTALCTFIPKAC